jgi:hypothetical protein
MARAAKAKPARIRSAGWKWWQGMLGGMLLMLSPGAAVLLLALSAPALLVMIADITPKRVLTRTVILFSLAGAIEPVRAFLMSGHDIAAALDILMRPTTVLFAWLCAGCGWLLNELSCLIAAFTMNLRLAARKAALEAMLLQVRTEWELPSVPPT